MLEGPERAGAGSRGTATMAGAEETTLAGQAAEFRRTSRPRYEWRSDAS